MYEVIIGRIPKDKEKLGKRGTIFIGKQYVKMGQTISLSNEVYMDVSRSHIVSVFGKRGGGKCLHGDTLITLDNGLTMPIKELENNNNNIFTLKHDLKIDKSSKTGFYKRQVNKLLEIKLRSGKKIKLTPEHPLLTIKGWIPAERLKINDRLATPRKIQSFGNNILSEEEVKILAYMIAEGQTRCMFFCNYDKKIVNDLANSVKSFSPNLELTQIRENHYKINSRKEHRKVLDYKIIKDSKGRFTKGTSITMEKSKIRQLLEKHDLYNKHSIKKKISNQLLQLPKNRMSLFLNRLFSCDGSIYKNKHRNDSYTWQISYSSSSKTLIRQIQNLLLRFEILSKLREKKVKCNNKIFDTYELVIRTDNVIKFIQEIGFYGEKEIKQKIALKETTSLNPNVDTIPKELWDFYRPSNWVDAGKILGYKIPKSARSSINYSASRQKLLQIAEADNNKRIKQLALSDIFWDEINDIKELNGNFTVYDISVPKYHNFIANDIIVHNSYTMGVLAEGMSNLPKEISQNISIIILDTMGIYWTMKYPNKKDEKLLREWGLDGKGLNVQIYTPSGYFKKYKEKGVSDFPFSVKPSELDASDWCMTFGIKLTDDLGVLIEKVISKLKETNEDYSIEDIINEIRQEQIDDSLKYAAENRFNNALSWGLFSDKGTKLKDIVSGGRVTVIDISCYATIPGAREIRALVIGLIAEKLFIERMISRKNEEYSSIHETMHYFSEEKKMKKLETPMVWLVIDECLPYSSQVQTEYGPKKIGEIVNDFFKGKKIKVIGYDPNTRNYALYPVTKCYKRPKRELMAFITETGQSITCTPDHKIFSRNSFCEARDSKDIAVPLLKPYKNQKKLVEARLLGAIFGDGWLSTNEKSVGFSGNGNNNDLEKIKRDLSYLGFKSSSINSRKTESKIFTSKGKIKSVKGISHSITSSTKTHRHFRKLGAPVGTKVLVPFKVPSWIINGSKEIKCEFLAGLMGADGQIITQDKNVKSDFNPIRLSFNKIIILEKNAIIFAKQLKKIFEDIGVKISNIKKRSGNIRGDGHKTLKIVMTIAKSIDNTIKYLENIEYRYCEKKEIEGEKWLHYLRYRKNTINKRNNLRIKAIQLHKEQHLGKVRISRILKIPDYIIRDWIYYNGKAGMPKNSPSFHEWIKKRVFGNNLFLKIIKKKKSKEEVVYDLSVDKVHNFIADGFLVHNCHEFLPREGTTLASHPLITILREGREPGISLILASQQPGKIHTDVITQSDIVLSHRLTAKLDIDSLGLLMQSYMRTGLDKQLDTLPRVKGAGIIFDDVNERIYPIQIRPRFTWHGGEAPTAVLE